MCGIIGICGNLRHSDLEWLDKASILLRHRGPNSKGKWISSKNNIALAHVRLSIIDTNDNNNQPFISNDGKLVLVFNGEIYNYIEIRAKLKNYGFHFRTNGDTEVLLNAYKHWGEDCLNYLNGMWAFAILDQRRGSGHEKLFVSRDRAGKKPFYYKYTSNRFEFASELKGLQNDGGIDLNALNHYLALGYIPGELCISSGVKKLPPAHAGVYDFEKRKFEIWRYWQLPKYEFQQNNLSCQELAQKSWNLLKDSVQLRLRSDVSTGIFLSGGIDSSLITAAAVNISNNHIKTFNVSLPGSPLDEHKHANLIANHFGTEHYSLKIEKPSMRHLDELKTYVDEPLADSSIIPSFLISKMTSKYVTVALGGDGGDELYGGYHHYQNSLLSQVLLGWLPKSFLKYSSKIAASLPAGTKGRNFISSLINGPLQKNIWGSAYFDLHLRKKLLHPELLEELGTEIDAPERRSLELYLQGSNPVENLTRMDFQQVLADDFLVKIDRSSMANSLEVRNPFLDYRLIEHAFKEIPGEYKVTLKERRKIQNIMVRNFLPKNFEINRKQGFSIPIDEWIRSIPQKEIFSKTNNKYFREDFINNLIKGQFQKKSNGSRLFSLIMFNLMDNK